MGRREELEAALAASPDDLELHAIYADLLSDAGDPRGELISLDLAIERGVAAHAERRALLRKHHDLAPMPSGNDTSFVWRRGYVHELWLDGPYERAPAVFAHPALARMTRLRLLDWTVRTPERQAEQLGLVASCAPVTRIRSLAFSLGRSRDITEDLFDLDVAMRAFPQLERLTVPLPVRYTEVHLRELEVAWSPASPPLPRASLPSLERLVLTSVRFPFVYGSAPEELAWLFDTPPPRLTELVVEDAFFDDARLAALAASPLLRQLRVLRLWNAGLTAVTARHITRERFGHLQVLDLTDAGLDAETERMLAGVCREVITVPPRLRAAR